MITDLVVGLLGLIAGLMLGFGWLNSILILLAALAIDGDILLNEFYRIFIKKEKRFSMNTILDEYSYTHKFVLHLPLVILPTVFIVGSLYADYLFGLLTSLMVLFHLIHDTVDNNFDGVSWLWPISSHVYKLRRGHLETKTRNDLMMEAGIKAQKSRDSGDILKDNSMF